MNKPGRRLPPTVNIGIISKTTPIEQRFKLIYQWMQGVNPVIAGGYPAKHGSSHTGGDDSIINTSITPSEVTPGSVGSGGNANTGASAADHEHPFTGGLADLADLDADPADGAFVTDPQLRRLLEEMLVNQYQIEELLRELVN